ncbi:histone family protein nucleoid-structuring protein H-NS [Caballeronia calidae]|uniref:Histone family protein nucleoid-structuring protein H-NS n=1 Tax=Caballeronia calidae TaxID=1777139 RepID=A0A158E0U2_9BURK|nr:H-NS family nucleoid-associated regulatory protein [Caballeronia calidae]SAL00290.1 histone family protein nucleoid-structuring protein H-NS [Caballeronia calidae]
MSTLENIQARMKKLQAQAETILAKQAQAAVDQIRELMLKHGLTTADIEARAKAKRAAKASLRTAVSRGVKASITSTGKLPAKYQNPKTGETWSGHARPPAWIKDVKDRTKFLIDGTTSASSAKTVGASSGKTLAGKVQSKGALPAKYRDPKSGASWSGRGPAPKWLASAKDRSKFLIEQAPAATSDASATLKATTSNAGPKVRAATKKVGAKTAVTSKKSAGVKRAATKGPTKATVGARKTSARKTTSSKVTRNTTAAAPAPEAANIASV